MTPAVATNFQLDAGYFDSVGSTSLKLYDTQGNLIEQRTNTGQGIFKFNVEGLPVAKWRIEPVGDEPAGFAIDNVCFTLETVKESVRSYPDYLRNRDTLESVSETDLPASERPLPEHLVPPVTPQSQHDQDYVEPTEIPSLQPSQNSTPISIDSVPIAPDLVATLSCHGIGTPLNKKTLLQIGKQVRPGATRREIEEAFEGFTLDSQMLQKYPGPSFKSPERFQKTRNRRQPYYGVVPEAATTVTIEIYSDGTLPIKIPYLNSAFWDAKAYREGKTITPTTSDYQTLGYLDYLSHYSKAAEASYAFVPKSMHPRGHLIYMTTSDVGIIAVVTKVRTLL